MKKIGIYLLTLLPVVLFQACQEDFELSGETPTEEMADFSYVASAENDNIIEFTAPSSTTIKRWDLGNGASGEGLTVTGTYPLAGVYEVTLTLYGNGGSIAVTKEITIAETDPTLLDNELYNLLTGGSDQTEGKTWVIDSANSGHFGVGPDPSSSAGDTPEYYSAGANEKAGAGMYDDRYTFTLDNFGFTMQTNGDVYINSEQTGNFSGATEADAGDYTAPFTADDDLTWTIVESDDDYPELTINGNGFIGYYTGVQTYQIINLEENELYLRYLDGATDGLAWYLRLIPEGYDGSAEEEEEEEEESTDLSLPLDFESVQPTFTTFGESDYSYVDNPDNTGINSSATVLQTTHGSETWAGIYVDLAEPIDLTATTVVSLKVYAPTTGTFRFKLENPDDDTDVLEIDAEVEAANAWVELSFDIADAADRNLSRVVLFPGWNVANAGTFYIDDIQQSISLPLTFEVGQPTFTTFGESDYSYVDNPDNSGINSSATVLQTTHGTETWAGIYVDLSASLDLSTSTTVSLKVYAPTTGTFRLKLENPDDDTDILEVDASLDASNQWVELEFDVSDAADRNLSRLVLFPGWNVASAGVFYIDDIQMAE